MERNHGKTEDDESFIEIFFHYFKNPSPFSKYNYQKLIKKELYPRQYQKRPYFWNSSTT
jgi:hypothetical protein